jgi:hypothetical protein
MGRKFFLTLFFILIILISGCDDNAVSSEKIPTYTPGRIEEPKLSYDPPKYNFIEKQYDNEEYELPLDGMPENYVRDIIGKFDMEFNDKQQEILQKNGVLIISGEEEKFEDAYRILSESRSYNIHGKYEYDESGIPIIITTDSVLHLFHIEFNELLKTIELNKLIPMLNEFLDKSIEKTYEQYNGLEKKELRELSRRNLAYLSVAKKLLDPYYNIPKIVKIEVDEEIKRIEDHKGFFKSPLFSIDCPNKCAYGFQFSVGDYPSGEKCKQNIKGIKITYNGKTYDSVDFYKEVCSRKCYCEDYSQYIPRGHYTSSEALKQYFKSMIWLGRMTFKARGEDWTKQAVLLTDAVKSAEVIDLWNKIYTVTGFFAGASDDLTFYEYDEAVFNLFNYEFNEDEKLKEQITENFQSKIREIRGPKILGGFEFDLAGNLKDTTQGLRLIGQRYALDSHVLSDLVYNNVGPNPDSEYYNEVLDYCVKTSCLGSPVCSEKKEFYKSCEKMDKNKTKYWNEVCDAAMELYCGCSGCPDETPKEIYEKLYSVCRFMPTGLDVMSALGSFKADELLEEEKRSSYCSYEEKNKEMKELVKSYDQEKWTENLYNTWLWMLEPVLKNKPKGYPNWMRTNFWRIKDLNTGLSSWAQLRHDTILYVKQSYTRAVAMMKATSTGPMSSRYYGYVEPNPELYARAKFITEYLIKGLEEQDVMTENVKNALEQSKEMMEKLQEISEKELTGEALTEQDYNYIEGIDETFNRIIKDLASALTVQGKKPSGIGKLKEEKKLEGKDDAFKTTIIADVHTETNTKKALEVGTGKIDWLIVAHESKDGRVGIAVGPIFSYYEFPWPMKDRLTDEKWREEVIDDVERPEWLKEYIS